MRGIRTVNDPSQQKPQEPHRPTARKEPRQKPDRPSPQRPNGKGERCIGCLTLAGRHAVFQYAVGLPQHIRFRPFDAIRFGTDYEVSLLKHTAVPCSYHDHSFLCASEHEAPLRRWISAPDRAGADTSLRGFPPRTAFSQSIGKSPRDYILENVTKW